MESEYRMKSDTILSILSKIKVEIELMHKERQVTMIEYLKIKSKLGTLNSKISQKQFELLRNIP